MIGGGRRLLPEILDQTDRVGAKSPIFDLFAHSNSAITCSEKSSINTNRKCTTHFPVSQDEHRTLSLSPEGRLKNAKCTKFEQYAAITPKLYEIGCQLLLITNRKSHMGF